MTKVPFFIVDDNQYIGHRFVFLRIHFFEDKSIINNVIGATSFFACGSFFASLNSEASLHRLGKPLPLVFEPLEYPGAIDMEMEFVVCGVSLDLYLCQHLLATEMY